MTRGLSFLGLGLTLVLLDSCSQAPRAGSASFDSTAVQGRAGFETQVAARLDSVGDRLDSLEAGAKALPPKLGVAIDREIAVVQVERDSAEVRLDRLRALSQEKWRVARGDFAVMLDSLDTRVERLRSKLSRSG
jgi:hypothetical protein